MIDVLEPPAASPVPATLLREHLRLGGDEGQDATLGVYLAAAVRYVEQQTGRELSIKTYLSCTAGIGPHEPVRLCRAPHHDVLDLVATGADGAETRPTGWRVQTADDGADIWPPKDGWPPGGSVTVTSRAGYKDIPAPLQAAVLLVAADLYEHRAETVTGTIVARLGAVQALIDPYRSAWG